MKRFKFYCFLLTFMTCKMAFGQVEVLTDFGSNDKKKINTIHRVNDTTYVYYLLHSIWRTDGTVDGTYKLYEDPYSNGDFTQAFTKPLGILNGKSIFLLADFSVSFGYKLWQTDGTVAGTHKISNSKGGGYFGILDYKCEIEESAVLNNFLYFKSANADGVTSLMRTDGTDAGTEVLISKIDTTEKISTYFITPIYNWNDHLYFTKDTINNGLPLCIVDIEKKEAKQIAFINSAYRLLESKIVNDSIVIFLTQRPNADKSDLYSFNLNTNTLIKLKAFEKGLEYEDYVIHHPLFTTYNNAEYFAAFVDNGNIGLYKTDGTVSGTLGVKSFSSGYLPKVFYLYNDEMYFYAESGTIVAVYKINNKDEVSPVVTLGYSQIGYQEQNLMVLGNELLYNGDYDSPFSSNNIGDELYSYNFLSKDTNLIVNYNKEIGSSPGYFFKLTEKSMIYINNDDENAGTTLYKYTLHPVSYKENLEDTDIRIFPNPVVDKLLVQYDSHSYKKFTNFSILNVLGQAELNGSTHEGSDEEINIGSLTSGLHYLQLYGDKNHYCLPFYKK